MGFVDRGGGREAKGTSLRRSKKNPGAPTTKNKSAHKNYITPTTRATPTPPPVCATFIKSLAEATEQKESSSNDTGARGETSRMAELIQSVVQQVEKGTALHMDAAVALLSRKLEDDQEGIFRRAVEEGKLAAALCWSNEVEKQATLLDTCVQHNKLYRGAAGAAAAAAASALPAPPVVKHVRFQEDVLAAASPVATTGSPLPSKAGGVILYAVLGIHVNSIDRVNMRLHEQWIKDLEENVKHGDVVGVLSGLNLSRDHGTHYAQERLLKECWRVAASVQLPLVLHLYAADSAALTETVNRAAELLTELLTSAKEGQEGSASNTNGAAASSSAATPSAIVLYNGLTPLQASPAMQQLVCRHRPTHASTTPPTVDVPFYVLVTAEGLVEAGANEQDGANGSANNTAASVDALSQLLPPRASIATSGHPNAAATQRDSDGAEKPSVVQLSQLLIGTGAPWGTPQNLPDPYLCTLPNEPGNYHYVVRTILDAMPTKRDKTEENEEKEAAVAALAAHAFVNELQVFFHECVRDAANNDSDDESSTDHDNDQQEKVMVQDKQSRPGKSTSDSASATDDELQQQQKWAASQQPAAPTVVAGLADAAAKRDLEALLAEAARERERVERERQREEAEREQARNDELQEKRSKREKKKNVKANNRSNFTHFRNKDFAPRQTRQEKLAHQRTLEGYVAGHTDSDLSDEESDEGAGEGEVVMTTASAAAAARSKNAGKKNVHRDVHHHEEDAAASSSSSSNSGSDSEEETDAPQGGLAAEVEMLLREAEKKSQDTRGTAGKAKKNNKKGAKNNQNKNNSSNTPPPPPAAAAAADDDDEGRHPASAGKGKGGKKKNASNKNNKKGRHAVSDSDQEDDDDGSENSDHDAAALQPTTQQPSRRQRKRQQKRQQQSKNGDDSDDE